MVEVTSGRPSMLTIQSWVGPEQVKTRIAIVTVVVLLIGLAVAFALVPRERTCSGTYTIGLEHQGFRADGNDEEWWVSGDVGDLNMTVGRTLPDGSRIFDGKGKVTLRGIVSSKGRYGHLGMWPRQITVTKVISVVPTN